MRTLVLSGDDSVPVAEVFPGDVLVDHLENPRAETHGRCRSVVHTHWQPGALSVP